METRRVGRTPLSITRVGIGTWAMGGANWERGWGPQSDRDSIAAILRALEHGINWIDTAAVYGLGHAETVVARALTEWSDRRPLIFTKCGLCPDANGRVQKQLSPASIRRECDDSLKRLRLDAIDLYQIHRPPDGPGVLEEAMLTLDALKREGKIRWIGVSNFSVAELAQANAVTPVATSQPRYSMIHREAESDVLPFCQQEGIGVLVYSPMAAGLLTGAMTRERVSRLPPDDWRSSDPDFNEPLLSHHLSVAAALERAAARTHQSPGALAVAWTLTHPAVTGAIVGFRSAAQVDDLMRASNWEGVSLAGDALGVVAGQQ